MSNWYRKPQSKYHNEPVTIDGVRYDGKHEAQRHAFLKMMEKSGEISDLRYHVRYDLIPKGDTDIILHFPDGDKHIKMHFDRTRFYEADFVYVNKKGEEIVEDFKGFETETFKQKRTLMKLIYNIDIKIVKLINASVN